MNIVKNYLYNVVYQVFILIVPLITIPYVTRVLGKWGVGVNAYTNSIIQYFILFGTIGIALYGNRAIAYVRDDKEKLSRTFWSIFFLKIITVIISYLCFLVFLFFVHQTPIIYLLQSIFIISAGVDVTWLYMGLEDFKKTVMRNLIVKIIGTLSIFVFVQTENDLWKYVLILSLSELIGQATMWFYVPKTVNKPIIKWNQIKVHILPALTLFLPQISIQIYAVLNKTMLGSFALKSEVAFFDNADKIVKISLALVTSMGVVMLPRISNTFAKGDMSKVKNYLHQSLDFASYLSVPLMFGMAGIATNFTSWYFPADFSKTGLLIIIICPIIVLIAWSNALGLQYLMPVGKMRAFTISVTIGAIVNFIANLILIQFYQSVGTAISTVIAETAVTMVQIIYAWRVIKFKEISLSLSKYLISGLVMYLCTSVIECLFRGGILLTLIQVIVGIFVYFFFLFVLRSNMNKKIFNKGLQIIRTRIKTRVNRN